MKGHKVGIISMETAPRQPLEVRGAAMMAWPSPDVLTV